MREFTNRDGRRLVEAMVQTIQENAVLLSDLDGVIGDGDHGVNMNKGFTLAAQRLSVQDWDLTQGLQVLGAVLLEEIGGAMGPLYGSFFGELATATAGQTTIDADVFHRMLKAGLSSIESLGGAQVGDKTLVDTLVPALAAFETIVDQGGTFAEALMGLQDAAERGKESTRALVAKVGRASRLGERSRGVLDAGSVSCWLLLRAMAQASLSLLETEKLVLYEFSMPYALGLIDIDGQRCVVGATEDHGPIVVSPPPYTSARILVEGPGGCMSLVSHPRFPGELFAIMGCFLGYNFHGGALYRIRATGLSAESVKLVDLPFAHRMEVVDRAGEATMLLANLASSKDSPQDWSRPGAVYAVPLDRPVSGPLPVLLSDIHKNHGFLKTTLGGRATVLISGAEGVFSLDLEAAADQGFTRILAHEVSEIAVFDLDGDGDDELITIEPFHGNLLVVYKTLKGGWTRVWQAELDYGHCVLADTLGGRPSILVSNRAGNKDLLLFQFSPGTNAFRSVARTVVEPGVGAANMLVVHEPDGDLIFATNQAQGQLVRYRLRVDEKKEDQKDRKSPSKSSKRLGPPGFEPGTKGL